MTNLEIVWRNTMPVSQHSRRQSHHVGVAGTLYIMQEFVDDGALSYWTTVSALEVLPGGRAA